MKTQVKTRDMEYDIEQSQDSDGVPVEVEEDTSEQHRHRLESAERRTALFLETLERAR